MGSRPRIVAILATRNEELHLGTCLEHLIAQGLEAYVIDNESTDRTLAIARSYLGRGVLGVETFPFTGHFEWDRLLERKVALSALIDADWFMHQDPDEIRLAPFPHRTLGDAVAYVERRGYNAINFDEFVFVPCDREEGYEGRNFVAEMMLYYYFAPGPLRQVKLWKRHADATFADTGGHRICFAGQRIYPVNFIIKHYIALSFRHLVAKYTGHRYSPRLLEKGWHRARARIAKDTVRLPPREWLKLHRDGREWDRSEPWTKHFFALS